ncbi:MAG: hypothetical protein ACKV2T_02180 [Kofleriaceae bacterium]
MNALDAEIALDRLEARLAAELPVHLAATASAYAAGLSAPAAIAITPREVEAVRVARTFAEHHARATQLLRVIAPVVIDSAPRVIGALARDRTWAHWRALAAARDEQARRWFGMPHRALVHALAGVPPAAQAADSSHSVVTAKGAPAAFEFADVVGATSAEFTVPEADEAAASRYGVPAPIDGWNHASGCDGGDDKAVLALWNALRGGDALGTLSVVRSSTAHPRTFVVERGVRAIIVVPAALDRPAAQFAVLHELGHALLWLAPASRAHEWPRAIDEAAASYVGRVMESPAETRFAAWSSPLARDARARRLVIAHVLDSIEAGGDPSGIDHPPWALWNDPHAQAAYIEAERIADSIPAGLRGAALAAHVAVHANAIDSRGADPH